ncbi:MAG TPA: hypothetical protein VJ750_07420 [Rhizomicrobium sp.]|nr:hypothetical protein [Rhizomicrobium sp.]
MSGAWYALATIALALVIWWYLKNDTGPSSPKARAEKDLKKRKLREGRN